MAYDNAAVPQRVRRRLRAKEACVKCRSRKVRCDVYMLGAPCTNCSYLGWPCLLHATKKRHGGIVNATKIYPQPERPREIPKDVAGAVATPVTNNLSHSLSPAASAVQPAEESRGQGNPHGGPRGSHPTLPGYVRWSDHEIAVERKHHLTATGAIALLEPAVMNSLLESYIDWVHPQLPFLDLGQFLATISSNGCTTQLSLLLLQAVLFAGALYMDDADLWPVAFSSARETKNTLRERIKILHDTSYERDRLILSQATLLLSLDKQSEFPDGRDSRYWLNTSLTAFWDWIDAQADSDVAAEPPLTRLGWSLSMAINIQTFRDGHQTISPSPVLPGQMAVPGISKFETRINAKTSAPVGQGSTLLHQPYLQKLLTELFIHRARLIKMVSRIIEEAAHRAADPPATTSGRTTEGDQQRGYVVKMLSRWDAELDTWWCGLPDYAADLKATFDTDSAASIRLLAFHFAVTATEFSTVVTAIHDFLMSMEDRSSLWNLAIQHKRSMNAAKILDVILSLDERDLPRYLRLHGLSVVESALHSCLSSSNLSCPSLETMKLLMVVKKFFDVRASMVHRPVSFARFMSKPAMHLDRASVADPPCHGLVVSLSHTNTGNMAEESVGDSVDYLSGCSAVPSLTETPLPDGEPGSFGNPTDNVDSLFSSCGVYTLDDDFISPCQGIDWLKN